MKVKLERHRVFFLSRWRSMEPDEIATLSLTLCLDLAITVPSEEGGWSWVGGV